MIAELPLPHRSTEMARLRWLNETVGLLRLVNHECLVPVSGDSGTQVPPSLVMTRDRGDAGFAVSPAPEGAGWGRLIGDRCCSGIDRCCSGIDCSGIDTVVSGLGEGYAHLRKLLGHGINDHLFLFYGAALTGSPRRIRGVISILQYTDPWRRRIAVRQVLKSEST